MCFLLTELFLCVHQPDKALSVITFLETFYHPGTSVEILNEGEDETIKSAMDSEINKEVRIYFVRDKMPSLKIFFTFWLLCFM